MAKGLTTQEATQAGFTQVESGMTEQEAVQAGFTEQERSWYDIPVTEKGYLWKRLGTVKREAKRKLSGGGILGIQQIAGLAQMVAENPGPVLYLMPDTKEKINAWGKTVYDASEQHFKEHPEELTKSEKEGLLPITMDYLTNPDKLVGGIMQSVPLLLEGTLGTLVAGPMGGIAMMGTPIAGETYAEARKEGDSPATALPRALLTGYIEAAIEQWTLGRKLGLTKYILGNKAGLRKIAWEGSKAYFRGMAEEGSQGFNRNFWRWTFTDRSQRLSEGVIESMAVGGPLEMAMAGGFSGVGMIGRPHNFSHQIQGLEKIRQTAIKDKSLTPEQTEEIQVEVDRIQDVMTQEFVELSRDRYPGEITDNATLAEIGNQMARDFGIDTPITWELIKSNKATGNWGLHTPVQKGVTKDRIKIYIKPGHNTSRALKETMVHELGHMAAPPRVTKQQLLTSLPKEYKVRKDNDVWMVTGPKNRMYGPGSLYKEEAIQDALEWLNRNRQYPRRSVHHKEFKQWVSDHVTNLGEAVKLSAPGRTYNEATGKKVANPWIRRTDAKSNKGRWLAVQFSNAITIEEDPAAKGYYDKLFQNRKGYKRMPDFWEPPLWMTYLPKNKTDAYVIRDMDEAKEFLQNAGYDTILMSVMDTNKELAKELAEGYAGKVIAGGYGDGLNSMRELQNAVVYDSMDDMAKGEKVSVSPSTQLDFFTDSDTIPRLCMSKGCLHKCRFCSVPKGITETLESVIIRNAREMAKELKPELIYLDDKTFGQAKNHQFLPKIYKEVKKVNPNFQGFIIQTTAAQMNKLAEQKVEAPAVAEAQVSITQIKEPTDLITSKNEKTPVTDSSGTPIIVYHGTTAEFNKFSKAKLGEHTGAPSAKMGFFFASDPTTSKGYLTANRAKPKIVTEAAIATAKRTMESYEGLTAKRHKAQYAKWKAVYEDLLIRAKQQKDVPVILPTSINFEMQGNIKSANLVIQNPKIVKMQGRKRSVSYAKIISDAKKAGHDGVIITNTTDGGGVDTIWVVFSPNQIIDRGTLSVEEFDRTAKSSLVKGKRNFIEAAGIKYIELGVESFNDPILKAVNKPASEKVIQQAADKIRSIGSVSLIPNIIVGFPQETAETYSRTLQWLQANADIISHLNIYNLALHGGTELAAELKTDKDIDLNENQVAKSFHENPEIHEAASRAFYALGNDLLDQQAPADIESEVEEGNRQVSEASKPSRKKLLTLGHKLAKAMELTKEKRYAIQKELTGKESMKDMDMTELTQVVDYFREQYDGDIEISKEDTETPIIFNGQATTMGTIMRSVVDTIDKLKGKSVPPKDVTMKYRRAIKRQTKGTAVDFLVGIDNSNLSTLAFMLGEGKDSIFTDIFRDSFLNGTKTESYHIKSVFDTLKERLAIAKITDEDLARFSRSSNPRFNFIDALPVHGMIGTDTETIRVSLGNKTFEMTWGEILDIYLAAKQYKEVEIEEGETEQLKDGERHLLSGGTYVGEVETGPISEEQLNNINILIESDPKLLAIADVINEIDVVYWKPSINQISMNLKGKQIATTTDWWGLEVAYEPGLAGKGFSFDVNLIENKSILRDRTKSELPLVTRDAFDRFVKFENAIAEYFSMSEPLRIARTVINNQDIRDALRQKGYSKVIKNVEIILKRAQSVKEPGGVFGKYLRKILHGAYAAVLFANPRVIASQYTSTAVYEAYTDKSYLASSIKKAASLDAIKQTLDISPVAWRRFYMGRGTMELGELVANDAVLSAFSNKSSWRNRMAYGIKAVDLAALTVGMQIAIGEYKAAQSGNIKGKSAEWWADRRVDFEEGSESWKQIVSKRAEWLWTQTQPSWDKWFRSVNLGEPSLTKRVITGMLFRSFHEKALNVVQQSYSEYQNSPKASEDIARFADKTGAVISSYVVNILIRGLIVSAMGRKMKKPIEWLIDVISSPLSMIPFIGRYLQDTLGNFIRVYSGEKPKFTGKIFEPLPVSIVNNITNSTGNFSLGVAFYLRGDEEQAEKSFNRGLKQATEAASLISGVPYYEIRRFVKKKETTTGSSRSGGRYRGR